jgi:hypothetical protein
MYVLKINLKMYCHFQCRAEKVFGDGYLANVIFWVNVAVFFSK